MYLDGRRWALIIVQPIAAQLQCTAPQSEELVAEALRTYAKLLACAPNCRASCPGEMSPNTGLLAGPKLFVSG
jgi:hypothetical protein